MHFIKCLSYTLLSLNYLFILKWYFKYFEEHQLTSKHIGLSRTRQAPPHFHAHIPPKSSLHICSWSLTTASSFTKASHCHRLIIQSPLYRKGLRITAYLVTKYSHPCLQQSPSVLWRSPSVSTCSPFYPQECKDSVFPLHPVAGHLHLVCSSTPGNKNNCQYPICHPKDISLNKPMYLNSKPIYNCSTLQYVGWNTLVCCLSKPMYL